MGRSHRPWLESTRKLRYKTWNTNNNCTTNGSSGDIRVLPSIIPAMSQLLPQSITPQLPAPPPPPPTEDVERAAEVDAGHKPYPSSPLAQHNLNWSKLAIAFCFGSALEIAHQSQQYSQSQLSQFPSTLYLVLCFAISVSFSCIFVAIFIRFKFSMAAQVLEYVGVFSAVTAFFLAITSPFPLYLKCTIWALYGVSLLAIVICHLL